MRLMRSSTKQPREVIELNYGEGPKKLAAWFEDHPDDYFHKSLNQIAKEVGVPFSTVQKNLHQWVAEREGLTPSQVKKMRQHRRCEVHKISRHKVKAFHNAGRSVDDIAFMLECGTETVRAALREIREAENVQTEEVLEDS